MAGATRIYGKTKNGENFPVFAFVCRFIRTKFCFRSFGAGALDVSCEDLLPVSYDIMGPAVVSTG